MKPILSAEEILDKYYEPKMHWKSVNRAKVIEAMEAYHSQFNQSEEDHVPGVPAEDSASVASHSCAKGNYIDQQQKDSL